MLLKVARRLLAEEDSLSAKLLSATFPSFTLALTRR